MAIIVEDGTQVPGANSFISVAYLQQYATDRDITLTGDTSVLEANLIRAMDRLYGYRMQFSGTKIKGAPLFYPRDDSYVDGEPWPNDEIPEELKKAQAVFAVAVNGGTALYANNTADTQVLKREKIDVLEFEYAVSSSDPNYVSQPVIAEAEQLLSALYGVNYDNVFNIKMVRA